MECFCLSESTLDHDCVTLQHGGKDIKNRCGLLSLEYGVVGGGVIREGGHRFWAKHSPVIDC